MKNQSAFPVGNTEYGLTKLEYFAGLAMQGILGSSEHWGANSGLSSNKEFITKTSIGFAKELIKQLENDIQ